LAGNLANLYLAQQRLPEAEVAFKKALAFAETCYGKDSPRLTVPLCHLGAIYGQTGRLEEAEPLLQRAIAVGGDDTRSLDLGLANAWSNLGLLYATAGRLPEAVTAWQHCAAMERRLRPGSRQHLEVLHNLAGAKDELRDSDGAAALRAEAEAARK
jgi:tetratricopeptide (TPR) repeat protein